MSNEEPMVVEAGGATLHGTLHLARGGAEPQPAIVLLHGASGGERTSFPAYVERFRSEGIAVVTFDRRGSGQSTGAPDMDIERWAADAASVHHWTAAQHAVDPGRVALWGYSNGAWVAADAARVSSCAALVLAGAAAVSPGRSEAYRRVEDLRPFGIADATLDAIYEAWSIIFDCLGAGLWDAERKRRLEAARSVIEADTSLPSVPVPEFVRANPRLDSIPRFDRPPLDGDLGALAGAMPWMAYDPLPALAATTCPVLVMLAERDLNNPSAESAPLFREAATGRAGPMTVVVIPGASHSFTLQPRTDRDVLAGAPPPSVEDLLPEYLETMARWLAEQLGTRSATLEG